jgi:hypothetical protein
VEDFLTAVAVTDSDVALVASLAVVALTMAAGVAAMTDAAGGAEAVAVITIAIAINDNL